MGISTELAVIFPSKSLREDFQGIRESNKFLIKEVYFGYPDDIDRLIDYIASQESFLLQDFPDNIDPSCQFLLEINGIKKDNTIRFHSHDRPEIDIRMNFNYHYHGRFVNGEVVGISIAFSIDHISHIYNFLGSQAVEEFFKEWVPIYSWSATTPSIYKKKHEYEYLSFLNTPWLHYSDTMIFGPDLVNSLKLKDIDWQHKDVFFAKWITEDILWIASPYGFRSRYEYISDNLDFDVFKDYFEVKSKPIMEKHRDYVVQQLDLLDGIWNSY